MITNGIVIFGGTGDLAYRKLFPALYNIHCLNLLPEDYKIIGIGRRNYSDEEYIDIIKSWMKDFSRIKYTDKDFETFKKRIRYYKMDMSDKSEYGKLVKFLDQYKHNQCPFTFYYAVAPSLFASITEGLSLSGFCCDKTKVIIEKPFGEDLESANKIYSSLNKTFNKENIYHIDHYLGKEMIINIMTLRFANAMFYGVWNKDYIDNVEINVFEKVGVESRGGYYDKSGALADMIQNHLFQIMTIVAMEKPEIQDSKSIKDEQSKVLKALKEIDPKKIDDILYMGQYEGYREEDKVDRNSVTETYAALKLYIENERWAGVPFYLRTGKAMSDRNSEVVINFKPLYEGADGDKIVIKIQPDEGVKVKFNIKKPGTENDVQAVEMDFCQSCIIENRENTPEAYERLFIAAMKNDKTLFTRWDQIELSWNYKNKVIDAYKKYSNKLHFYKKGSEGPIGGF